MTSDDPLKQLFDNYDPDLRDTDAFMNNLEARLDSVEIIRSHAAATRRRYIIAALIAAFAGFISGVIITILLPHIGLQMLISEASATAPGLMPNFLSPITIISVLLTAAISLFIALNTYTVTLTALNPLRSGKNARV